MQTGRGCCGIEAPVPSGTWVGHSNLQYRGKFLRWHLLARRTVSPREWHGEQNKTEQSWSRGVRLWVLGCARRWPSCCVSSIRPHSPLSAVSGPVCAPRLALQQRKPGPTQHRRPLFPSLSSHAVARSVCASGHHRLGEDGRSSGLAKPKETHMPLDPVA